MPSFGDGGTTGAIESPAARGAHRAVPLAVPALRAAVPYVAVAAITVLLGLPTLILPLHPDQALFALIGQAVGRGEFPYVDAWDVKTPSLWFIYAVAVRGPFDVMRDVRVFDLVWTAATAAVVVALGARWWSVRAGVLAGLIYAVAAETGNPWYQSAQPDSFVALPLLGALLLYDTADGRRSRLAAAGLLLGFAVQLRFVAALLIPFFPLVELWGVPAGERARLWLGRMLWLGVGVAAFQLALVLYLIAGGALGEFVQTMRFAGWYTRQGGPWNGPDGPTLGGFLNAVRLGFWNWALSRVALTAPALAGGFCGALILRERRVARLMIFVALAYVGIAVQAKLFWYQFGPLVPLLALLGGWTWDWLWRRLRREYAAPVALAAAGTLAAALALGSPEVWENGRRDWLNYAAYLRHPEQREQLLGVYSAFPQRREVAEYIAARTTPGEAVYVWGFDPFTYLLAERPGASRFLVSFPLMAEWQPASWRPSFMAELRERRPMYVIVQRGHAGSWVVGRDLDMAEAVAEFPELGAWLAETYELETELHGRLIYRRRDAG